MLAVRCVISSSSSRASTTASSSPCMLITRQSLLVVISTAASAKRCIKFTSSAPYSPESNGLAEIFNKVLFARVRCRLDHFGMDKVMWGDASHHAVHLLNITPSRSLGNITRHEAEYGVVPDVSKLRMFGCVALQRSHIPRSLTTRQCALPTWVTLVTERIVCCCREPTKSYSSRPL
jgi:hypothetical protein